nr:pentatricopeptide repeat-containing protein At3g29230-like [Ipomoea batatas]
MFGGNGAHSSLPKIGEVALNLVSKPPHRLLEEKFISLLQSCKTTRNLKQIQAQITIHGLNQNEYTTPHFLLKCFELNQVLHARHLFDQIPYPSSSLWNAMFKGYLQKDQHREVLVLFRRMRNNDERPSCYTFPIILKSCGKLYALREGEEVHCVVIKIGLKSNTFVGTTLIDLYSRARKIESAHRVFSEMVLRNVVSWTSMINGYVENGDLASARRFFDLAPERDIVLWNSMIVAYIGCRDMVEAQKLFNVMPNKDLMSWNTLLNGYANSGDVEGCERVFEAMQERNIFSWNGLIGGYAHNGHFLEVLDAFKRMLTESDVQPNDATLVNVLSACARLGALDMGKWVHAYAESIGYIDNIFVGNGLIDMYAKCGVVRNAIDVFKSMDKKDLISWNTIINGVAVHGQGADALNLFSQMSNAGVRPDGITFIGVLCACSHMGLVSEGFHYFQSMINEYLVVPQIEHYGCMVDLLARAGHFDQAVDFVHKMPMPADSVIWTSLLGACRIYKNIEVAILALQKLIELDPNNPANYVMLANIYGDAKRWKDVAKQKVAMRDTGFKKLPGCSLVEVDDEVAEFYCYDERHPKTQAIYGALKGLMKISMSSVAAGNQQLRFQFRHRGTDPLKDNHLLLQAQALDDTEEAKHKAAVVNELSKEISCILVAHPLNAKWAAEGKNITNVPQFEKIHGLWPCMVAPTKIFAGLGLSLGIDILEAPEATGDYRTILTSKTTAIVKTLSAPLQSCLNIFVPGEDEHKPGRSDGYDFGFLHTKAIDDVGHDKVSVFKVKGLEAVDRAIGQLAKLLWPAESSGKTCPFCIV